MPIIDTNLDNQRQERYQYRTNEIINRRRGATEALLNNPSPFITVHDPVTATQPEENNEMEEENQEESTEDYLVDAIVRADIHEANSRHGYLWLASEDIDRILNQSIFSSRGFRDALSSSHHNRTEDQFKEDYIAFLRNKVERIILGLESSIDRSNFESFIYYHTSVSGWRYLLCLLGFSEMCTCCTEIVSTSRITLRNQQIYRGRNPTRPLNICVGCFDNLQVCDECGIYYQNWEECRECPLCTQQRQCSNCRRYVDTTHNRNYYYYCDSCNESLSSVPIQYYSFTPINLQMFGAPPKNNLYFGVEVEVESHYMTPESAAWIVTQAGDGFFYCKQDSSIDDGLEIVTCPFSYQYYLDNPDRFNPVFSLRNFKCSSSNDTCGIHVHMSLKAFSDLHLFKLLNLIYDNQDFIIGISDRTADQLASWCSLQLGRSRIARRKEKIRRIKNKGARAFIDRHTAVNTTNPNTIEIRIFKGTLHPGRLKSTIEFADAAYHYTKDESLSLVSPKRFYSYVKKHRHLYGNLADRMKSIEERIK